MHNDILNWQSKIPMLMANGSPHVMEMFIEKILSQNTNNTKVEMLDWFNRSVIGYDDNKQRFLVKVEKIKIEELNK